jgi:DNA-binding response OmpR family regulator
MIQEKTVLIIEDNATYANVIRKRLESRGFRTQIESDGLRGYAEAHRIKPDLVLLDLMLPGLDGHKVCRLIKFDRNLRHTPVAIFTSRDTDADEAIAKAAHADAYMLKTVSPEIMVRTVLGLLEKAAKAGHSELPRESERSASLTLEFVSAEAA